MPYLFLCLLNDEENTPASKFCIKGKSIIVKEKPKIVVPSKVQIAE
jgi:hypothetical protein